MTDKDELGRILKEAGEAELKEDFLAAAFQYKFALEIAKKLGDKMSINLCKTKVVEMNKKSQSSFQQISAETQIPTEEINKVVDSIIKEDLPITLKKIGIHPILCPNYAHILEITNKSMPVSMAIASLSVISNEGHLVKGGGDGNYSWAMHNYGIQQGVINQIFLKEVYSRLAEKGFDRETLLEYLRSTSAFSAINLEIIEMGIERYFAGDFVSSIHILVPQFEYTFLTLSEKCGLDTISLNRGSDVSTQNRTLSSELLSSETFQRAWGLDFCEQLKFVLYEPLGYMLRHKIAHGVITKEECTQETVNLIIYFYLVLAGRVAKKPIS